MPSYVIVDSPVLSSGDGDSSSYLLNASLSPNKSVPNPALTRSACSATRPSDVVTWVAAISRCYSAQLSVNRCVVQQMCHLSTRTEALFHCSCWTVQPAVTNSCGVSEACCRALLKTLSTTS